MPRLEIRPSGRTPGGIFHLPERGAGWSSTPSIPTRPRKFFNFSWDPLSQIFWRIKIVLLAYSPQVFGYGVSGYSFRARTILSPQRSIARSTARHDRYVPTFRRGCSYSDSTPVPNGRFPCGFMPACFHTLSETPHVYRLPSLTGARRHSRSLCMARGSRGNRSCFIIVLPRDPRPSHYKWPVSDLA